MTTHLTETDRSAQRRLVAAATILIAVGLPVTAILTADIRGVETQPGLIDWIFVATVAVVAVATFGILVPRAERSTPARPARSATLGLALSLGALVLSVILFWTMIPLIFGSAGAWLGYLARGHARDAGHPTGRATTAVVLGLVTVLWTVAAYVATS